MEKRIDMTIDCIPFQHFGKKALVECEARSNIST